MAYLGVWAIVFENILSYLKLKFGTKNALFGYFSTGI